MNASEPLSEQKKRNAKQVAILFFLMCVRVVVNTLHRMVYPFLPEFSRALGVSPVTFTNAIAFRSASGLLSPFFARLGDSRGRKFGMLMGMTLFLIGVACILLWPRFDVFIFGLTLAALGKYGLDPAVQAYIGDVIPPERKGEAIAFVELGWSLSYLVGGLAVGRLLLVADWTSPFYGIGFLGVLAIIGIVIFIPADRIKVERSRSIWRRTQEIISNRSARFGLLVGFLISGANELISVTFGIWLENSLQMKLAALASAALVIGVSELIGESLVGLITDRIGQRRSVGYGIIINCLTAILLPFVAVNPLSAYLGLFLFYLSFEFSLVSSISMMTSIKTTSKATLMGLNIAMLSLGRVAAAWVGLHIFAVSFFLVIAIVVLMNSFSVISLREVSLVQD